MSEFENEMLWGTNTGFGLSLNLKINAELRSTSVYTCNVTVPLPLSNVHLSGCGSWIFHWKHQTYRNFLRSYFYR